MIAAETGVPLDISSLITFCRHPYLLSAPVEVKKARACFVFLGVTQSARWKESAGLRCRKFHCFLNCCFFSLRFACQFLYEAGNVLFLRDCAGLTAEQDPCRA
jgi:hypothetical protein